MDISEFKKKPGIHPFQRHPWEIARGMFISGLVGHAKQAPVHHIADIGCGDAYIIALLAKKNTAALYSAFDNALDQDMLDGLRKDNGEKILFFRSLQDPGAKELPRPDIVLILDVLEHTIHEGTLLAETKKNLRTDENTRWIITVPAFPSVFSQHDIQLGHHRRYTLQSLGEVCERNDLLIDKKGYFFFSLLILRIIQRARQRRKKAPGQDTVQNWNGSKPLTGLFTLILSIDYKIGKLISRTGVNIPGLSCYCICHQSR